MAKLSKRVRAFRDKVDANRSYSLDEAVALLKEFGTAKFNETVEVAVNLGIDARKSDQGVRGATTLPHGTGAEVRVAVFTQGENAEKAKALGADFVANHGEGDLLQQFSEAGYSGNIDVILDIAGGDLTQTNLDLAAQDGRIVCIGVMRGMQSEINLATVFMKRLTLTGSTLRRLETTERARCFQSIREHIWPAVTSGAIAPIVDATYPLHEVLKAHQHMQAGGHFGKLVLDCRAA